MENSKQSLFEGILLLSDIDGTLLNAKKVIPQRNIDAIRRFTEQGGRFSLASGRCPQSVRPFAEVSGANCPAVTLNGAVVYDFQNEKTAVEKCLPAGYREMIGRVHAKYPFIGVQVYIRSELYVVYSNDVVERLVLIEHLPRKDIRFADLPEKANKVLFGGTTGQLEALRSFLNEGCNMDGMYGMFTETCYYEILPSHTNKGTAAAAVADYCRIQTQNVVAVGDYYNDIDLLKSVAYPIAAGNAPDDVKIFARFVTGGCEDGVVADAIEHLEARIVQNGHL